MSALHDLFEAALKRWHDETYLIERKEPPAGGVYLWHIVDRETGQICRIFYDSHLQKFDCGICRYRSNASIDGHCRHSLMVQIDTYVTGYSRERPDDSRREVVEDALATVREKIGIADADAAAPEPDDAGGDEAGQRGDDAPEEESLLHDEDLYIEADEIVIPWDGAFYGASLLELTETAEGRAYLQDLTTREPDPDEAGDDLRRHVDEIIRDAAKRVHAAICATYADGGTRAAAA